MFSGYYDGCRWLIGMCAVKENGIAAVTTIPLWRRARDSNPGSLSGHDFSRVAPSTTRTTLPIYFSSRSSPGKTRELRKRTNKNVNFEKHQKPCIYNGLRLFSLPLSSLDFECGSLWPLRYSSIFNLGDFEPISNQINLISSEARYDHFDTAPCMSTLFVPARFRLVPLDAFRKSGRHLGQTWQIFSY